MRDDIDVSIVICTRNRSTALHRTLLALAAMTVPATVRHEVIVVDNASSDDTKAVIDAAGIMLPVRYLHESRPGLGRARNVGLAQATGQLIFMTDDDCIVDPDWLETGLRLIAGNPRQIIGGRVGLHDPRDLPITIKTEDTAVSLISVGPLFGFLHGCNMIFGRSVADVIGPFDPLLGAGTRCRGAEDTDFVYRAFKAGVAVRYCPNLRIAHDHGRRDPADGQRLEQGYRISMGALTLKHLLRGRLDLVKLLYWRMRSAYRRGDRVRASDYAAGALAYLRSAA